MLGPVNNGRNLDQLTTHPVDDPKVLEDEFPKILPPVLRYDPAGLGKLPQLLNLGDNALDEEACVV